MAEGAYRKALEDHWKLLALDAGENDSQARLAHLSGLTAAYVSTCRTRGVNLSVCMSLADGSAAVPFASLLWSAVAEAEGLTPTVAPGNFRELPEAHRQLKVDEAHYAYDAGRLAYAREVSRVAWESGSFTPPARERVPLARAGLLYSRCLSGAREHEAALAVIADVLGHYRAEPFTHADALHAQVAVRRRVGLEAGATDEGESVRHYLEVANLLREMGHHHGLNHNARMRMLLGRRTELEQDDFARSWRAIHPHSGHRAAVSLVDLQQFARLGAWDRFVTAWPECAASVRKVPDACHAIRLRVAHLRAQGQKDLADRWLDLGLDLCSWTGFTYRLWEMRLLHPATQAT